MTRELGRRAKGMILIGVVCRAGLGARLRHQRFRRRHRVAAGGRAAGGAGVLPGRAGAAGRAGGRRRRHRSHPGGVVGCAVRRVARPSACGGSTPRWAPGPISVVSPLTAILVAGIPVGVGLALGERPGAIAGVGVGAGAGRRRAGQPGGHRRGRHPAPVHREGRLADGRLGCGVRAELRADRTRRRSRPSCGRWCSRGWRPACSCCVIAAMHGQPACSRGACRCGWRCWPRCSTPAPTSRCCWRCRRRCCRWPAC